ncbi:hypothetical protein LOK49_LG06G01967 [Camellia lanceoleosa]|uniref:Uncharacterized protein n=1 Tax=Camellia lanceoleosa TaxID=1840588 RepID=A0ACC0HEA1_9ERIC|nr:hypothetical protein LOK49_LG06G01967 [Camellia lanceoleosa]
MNIQQQKKTSETTSVDCIECKKPNLLPSFQNLKLMNWIFGYLVITILLTFFYQPLATAVTYNVVNLGAKPDGKTDSTKSFLSAWDAACASANPTTIYVPPGRYLLHKANFYGEQCKNTAITIRIDGTLVAPSDYRAIGNGGSWLIFEKVSGVSIFGGTLDGQGTGLWACKGSGKACPTGATTLALYNSKNIVINGLTSLNSQMFHIAIDGCHNVKVQRVKVSASGNSPNTDGIHIQLSSGVTISNSRITTGDNCVSIGPGSSNLWIENVVRGSPAMGSEPLTIYGSNKINSLIYYNFFFLLCTRVLISDVTYQDIHGTSATAVAVKFDCSKKYGCKGIRLEDVKLTFRINQIEASCVNVGGSTSGSVEPTSCL